MLEEVGWSARRPLREVLHAERWPAETPIAPTVEGRQATGNIEPVNEGARAAAQAHQAELTKPLGSLGRLEELATWYAAARGTFALDAVARPALAVFMADHGVVVEGVSAYGSQVTAAMACNVMSGGAAVTVLAQQSTVVLVAVDVGIAGDLSAAPRAPRVPLVSARVRAGTRNLRREPAMTREEVQAALDVGAAVADDLRAAGTWLAGVGEIGIGNTTSGAALVACFTGASPAEVCGRGTGIDDETLERKTRVVAEALARYAPSPGDPVGALAAVGGLELAAMSGFMLRAAAHRIPMVLDGFLSAAAALVARAMDPRVAGYLVASHVSAGRGARFALEALGLEPLLSLGLRLGEGTGAILGMDLVRSAVALQAGMATFATAGIVR
jgi:nicotinate-nucleotide--dimethylbenzimidazole phosphoribosyltransferase